MASTFEKFTIYKITTTGRTKPMWYIQHNIHWDYCTTYGPFRTKTNAKSIADKLSKVYEEIDSSTIKIKWKDSPEYFPFG